MIMLPVSYHPSTLKVNNDTLACWHAPVLEADHRPLSICLASKHWQQDWLRSRPGTLSHLIPFHILNLVVCDSLSFWREKTPQRLTHQILWGYGSYKLVSYMRPHLFPDDVRGFNQLPWPFRYHRYYNSDFESWIAQAKTASGRCRASGKHVTVKFT